LSSKFITCHKIAPQCRH